ncbi:MAG: hypothetical protein C0467_09885 [Planctomycetaceae bacterium]|nr:hypothetical protein [Planctomycetaceae bacterium]
MKRLFYLASFIAVLIAGGLTSSTRQEARADEPKAGKDFFFKPGDRIVFLGDSITAQYQYSSYIELYLTTRFPEANFTFLNAGIGGDTANGGAGRFQKHVLDEKPTAVTINFGMNDGGYGKFNPGANKTYVEKTKAMLDTAKKAGVRVALLSPNAVDRRNKSNGAEYVETQKQFYAPLKDIATEFEIPFVDQYAITRAATDAMEKDDPKAEKAKPYPDGFHTGPPGGLLMAGTILTGLNAPAMVSDVTVVVKTPQGEPQASGKSCAVDTLTATDTGVSFNRTDKSLPLPMQKEWLPMLPYMKELKDLNWYGLTVKGLKDGDYTVNIDGKPVGKFTAKELDAGVNLGNVMTGPIWEQGNKVLQAINAKNGMVSSRFSDVIRFTAPEWLKDVADERKPAELKKRMEKIEAAQAEVYRLAKPVAHKFEVVPAK